MDAKSTPPAVKKSSVTPKQSRKKTPQEKPESRPTNPVQSTEQINTPSDKKSAPGIGKGLICAIAIVLIGLVSYGIFILCFKTKSNPIIERDFPSLEPSTRLILMRHDKEIGDLAKKHIDTNALVRDLNQLDIDSRLATLERTQSGLQTRIRIFGDRLEKVESRPVIQMEQKGHDKPQEKLPIALKSQLVFPDPQGNWYGTKLIPNQPSKEYSIDACMNNAVRLSHEIDQSILVKVYLKKRGAVGERLIRDVRLPLTEKKLQDAESFVLIANQKTDDFIIWERY